MRCAPATQIERGQGRRTERHRCPERVERYLRCHGPFGSVDSEAQRVPATQRCTDDRGPVQPQRVQDRADERRLMRGRVDTPVLEGVSEPAAGQIDQVQRTP